MKLQEYFSKKAGVGVISTSNNIGEVNSAIYAKPHVIDKNTVAFIMRNKRTRANLHENTKANYLFTEHEHGFKGVRLNLTMIGEEQDREVIAALSRRASADEDANNDRFLVSFSVNRVLTLVGDDEITLQ